MLSRPCYILRVSTTGRSLWRRLMLGIQNRRQSSSRCDNVFNRPYEYDQRSLFFARNVFLYGTERSFRWLVVFAVWAGRVRIRSLSCDDGNLSRQDYYLFLLVQVITTAGSLLKTSLVNFRNIKLLL